MHATCVGTNRANNQWNSSSLLAAPRKRHGKRNSLRVALLTATPCQLGSRWIRQLRTARQKALLGHPVVRDGAASSLVLRGKCRCLHVLTVQRSTCRYVYPCWRHSRGSLRTYAHLTTTYCPGCTSGLLSIQRDKQLKTSAGYLFRHGRHTVFCLTLAVSQPCMTLVISGSYTTPIISSHGRVGREEAAAAACVSKRRFTLAAASAI